MLVLESCIGIGMSVQACISICETQSTLYWYNIGLINEYVEQHQHVGVCIYAKKMTTLSRKLRHTAVASLTVFITAKGWRGEGKWGTPYFNDL